MFLLFGRFEPENALNIFLKLSEIKCYKKDHFKRKDCTEIFLTF